MRIRHTLASAMSCLLVHSRAVLISSGRVLETKQRGRNSLLPPPFPPHKSSACHSASGVKKPARNDNIRQPLAAGSWKMANDNDSLLLSSLSVVANERDEALSLLSKMTGDVYQLMGTETNSLRLLTGCSTLVDILGKSKGDENGVCGEWANFLSHVLGVLSGLTNMSKLLEASGYLHVDGNFMECPIPPSIQPHKSSTGESINNTPNNAGELMKATPSSSLETTPIIDKEKEVENNLKDQALKQYEEDVATYQTTIENLKKELSDTKSALAFVHDERLYQNEKDETRCLQYYENQLEEHIVTKRQLMISERRAQVAEVKSKELRKQVDQLLVLAYPIEISQRTGGGPHHQIENHQTNLKTDADLITTSNLKELLGKQEAIIEQQRLDISSVGSMMSHMRFLRKLELQRVYQLAGKLREELLDVKQRLASQETYSFDLEMELVLHGLNSRLPMSNDQSSPSASPAFHYLSNTNVRPNELRSDEVLARAIFLHQKRHEWCEDETRNRSFLQSMTTTVEAIHKRKEELILKRMALSNQQESKSKEGIELAAKFPTEREEEEDEREDEEGKLRVKEEEVSEMESKLRFINQVSRNWNLLGLGAMDEFLNESYTWERETGDLVGEWGEVETLEPPPPHSLNSPLVNEILCQWTGDVLKQKALMTWMTKILDETDKETKATSSQSSSFPTLQLTRLSKDSIGGFLALVFPLLLRRQDIAVEVQTRERRSTAYDMRVQVSRIKRKLKNKALPVGLEGALRRSRSDNSLPQYTPKTAGGGCLGSVDEEEEAWKAWHHLVLRAAFEGHVEVNPGDDTQSDGE